jgi:hypothetical protein
MPDYSLHTLAADGDVEVSEEFFATSDEAAINHAARQSCPHGCEVWSRDRFVVAVTRKPDERPAAGPPPRRRRLGDFMHELRRA